MVTILPESLLRRACRHSNALFCIAGSITDIRHKSQGRLFDSDIDWQMDSRYRLSMKITRRKDK